MEIPFSSAVGMPGIEEGSDDAEDVGWDGEEESINAAVAESLNDSREEISDGAGSNEAEN